MIHNAMQDPHQFNRHIVRNASGEMEERIFPKVDSRAMLDMMKTVKLLVDVKQSILGITGIEHQERMDIARARLCLDRDRLEMDKQKSEMLKPDNDIVIRIEGFEEDWAK